MDGGRRQPVSILGKGAVAVSIVNLVTRTIRGDGSTDSRRASEKPLLPFAGRFSHFPPLLLHLAGRVSLPMDVDKFSKLLVKSKGSHRWLAKHSAGEVRLPPRVIQEYFALSSFVFAADHSVVCVFLVHERYT